MRGRIMIAATVLASALSLLAMAQDKAPGSDGSALPKAEQQTLESFGAANVVCIEWTDGCAVCLRHEDGKVACSLPGIACQPAAITCRRQK